MLDKISPQTKRFVLFLLVAALSGALMYSLLSSQ